MTDSLEDDGSGGRRDYDPDHPLISLMEQRLLRAFDKGLADTRHTMRSEIATLASTVAGSQEKATQEHALVQLAIVEMRGDVAELRTAIADIKPLKQDVERLKAHEDVADARDTATEALRRSMWKAAVTLITIIIAASGVIVAALS